MPKSNIKIGDVVTVKGKKYLIYVSPRRGKRYLAVPVNGRGLSYHFSHSDYSIHTGTKRGNNYCTRSKSIKSSRQRSANDFARLAWGCVGKKSIRKKK